MLSFNNYYYTGQLTRVYAHKNQQVIMFCYMRRSLHQCISICNCNEAYCKSKQRL